MDKETSIEMEKTFDVARASLLPVAGTVTDGDMLIVVQGGRVKRALPSAMKGKPGEPGASVFLGVDDTHVRWKQGAGGAWQSLIEIERLRGPRGERPVFRKEGGTLRMRYEGEPDSAFTDIFDRDELRLRYADLTPEEREELRGEKGEPLRFDDLTEEQRAELSRPATEAAAKCDTATRAAIEAKDSIQGIEADMRQQAESFARFTANADRMVEAISAGELARQQAETLRRTAEAERSKAEAARLMAEEARSKAETDRSTAEARRIESETARVDEEARRASAETGRAKAEILRSGEESKRAAAERDRQDAEARRGDSENARVGEESKRVAAESERSKAEASRAQTELTRETNERARSAAESERGKAEAARQTAEESRSKAETLRSDDEARRVESEKARAEAERKRQTDTATAIQAAGEATGEADKAAKRANTAAEAAEGVVSGVRPDWLASPDSPNYIANKPEIPTLDTPPTADTLGYVNAAGVTVPFRIGDEARVREDDGFVFYRLYDLLDGVAVWEESGAGASLPGNVYLQGATYYNDSVTVIKQGYYE